MASLTGTSLSISSISSSIKPRLGLCFRVSNPSSVSLSKKGKSFPSITMQPGTSHLRFVCAAQPETVDKVCSIVKKQLALPNDKVVNADSKFADFGADSLDTVEIVMKMEEEFGISVEEESAQTIATVHDAAELIDKLVKNKNA